MKAYTKRALSMLIVLTILVSVFAGISLTASAGSVAAVDPTGYTKAEDVKYVKVNSYVCNWGARGEDCTFLSTYAQNYYTGNYAYSVMSKLAGGTTQSNASSSALYSALKNMMVSKKTSETSYNATRNLYKYTDCLKSDYAHISSFYSGKLLNGEWDGGSTWNREHTWPNSKISGNGENDISMLRPTWVSENSDRGNKAYGESTPACYFPNAESNGKYDLRGDCARIILFVYTRWGITDTMWGTSGVMESMDILLKWMTEDPVDTWEMGRNDACQSIVGCRNAFVDFPEYAFLLFGKEIPANYVSPSSGSAPVSENYTINAVSNNSAWGTVSVKDYTITCTPASGYYLADAKITSGDGTLKISGNTITVSPKSNCTVSVTFAKLQTVSVSFVLPDGVTKAALSGVTGSKVTLSAPSGTPKDTTHTYTFAGWLDHELEDTTLVPNDLILPGTNYTLSKDISLYAVYSYPEDAEAQGDGAYVKVTKAPADWTGDYVIVYETDNYLFDSSRESLDAVNNYHRVDVISNQTISAEDGDPYKITIEAVKDGYAILCSNGQYMGMASSDNKILQSSTEKYTHSISLNENGGADIVSAACHFRYNKQNGQTRFRYYKAGSYSNQQDVYLYRKDNNTTITHYLTLTASTPQPCAHSFSNEVTAPTCTAQGYTTHTCTKCGYSYTDTYTKALGHAWDAGKVTLEPTATNDGVKTYTCTRCGTTKTEAIPSLGGCDHHHSYPVHKEATCTENGYDRIVCDDCGETISETTIKALGHAWDAGKVTKQPTCTAKGVKTYTCTRTGCGGVKTETVAALGHNFVDGVCTRCGAKDPNYKPDTSTCDGGSSCPSRAYSDLNTKEWYHEGVDYALTNDLMNGVGNGKFNPNGSLTRAMLVTILYRHEGKPDVSGENNPFKDVPNSKWYTDAIIWAAKEGIVMGTSETTFAPNASITREQIATILYRYEGLPDVSGNLFRFSDAFDVSTYAEDAMTWAVNEGIINGSAGKLSPKDNATRAQIATVLMRYLTK